MFTVAMQKARKYIHWWGLRRRSNPPPPQCYYFAYGANVSSTRFRDNHMNFECIGKAKIEGHRLEFCLATNLLGMGYASIGPDANSEVWGVLYRLDEPSLALLDVLEWVHYGYYDRRYFEASYEVDGRPQGVRAYAYQATNPQPDLIPSTEYIGHIINAAKSLGYPSAYVDRLAQQPHRPQQSFPMNPKFRISNPSKPRFLVNLLGPIYRANDVIRRQLMRRLP